MVQDFEEIHPREEDQGEDNSPESEVKCSWGPEQARRLQVIDAYNMLAKATHLLIQSRKAWEEVAGESPRKKRIEELNRLVNSAIDESNILNNIEDPSSANNRMVEAKAEREMILRDIEQAKKRRNRISDETQATLVRINEHRAELTRRRTELASKLSDGDLKLQVLGQADETTLEAELRELVQKPSSFDPVFDANGLPKILEHPFKPGREMRVADLKKLLLELQTHGGSAPLLKNYPSLTFDQRFFTHLSSLDAHSYETEINLWFPEDRLRVRYKQESDGRLSEIDAGSPGQKTAALLAVVLQLSNDPLLLDQPEDDLDNKLIYELVVTTLKRIKVNRQVIVVTHNANVVVNADAEHVTILRHGALPVVESHGSIQGTEMKKAICLIMEGGETAFESRYKRLLG